MYGMAGGSLHSIAEGDWITISKTTDCYGADGSENQKERYGF